MQKFEEQKDTQQLQQAIEQVMEDDTSTLPLLPNLNSIDSSPENQAEAGQVHRWFFTFMSMNIPIVGWIYLIYLGFNKKTTDRRSFARAYLFYKLVFLVVSVVILGILIVIGLDALDKLLAYMQML